MDIFLSDPAILVLSAIGLVATGWSIVRDARTQRAHALHAVAQEAVEIELRRAA